MKLFKSAVLLGAILFAAMVAVAAHAQSTAQLDESKVTKSLTELVNYGDTVAKLKSPEIPQPDWYKQQVTAEQRAAHKVSPSPRANPGSQVTVTYTISTKGGTRSNLDEFAAQAHQTLNDARGWAQLNISFVRVPSGGNFNLILSEASQVPSFSSGCSAEWSCRVGVSVIINDDRWSGATTAWNNAGGGIRDYRHMVINHEVGHWLGHGHSGCPAAGSHAPIMQQQSIDLQGCKFNPWPLANELRAPNLGR